MTAYTEPGLEHLFDLHIDLETPLILGATPHGMRQVYIIRGGTVSGPQGDGEVLPGGGDWAIVRTDSVIQLDVRATVKMSDGALIYATYSGIIAADPAVFRRLFAAEDVDLAEYYFYTNPMFQTAAAKYAALNSVIAVGRGRVIPNGVEYRVWAVRNA